jgi:hypothetical protein
MKRKKSYPEEWGTKAPRLATIAKWINEHTTLLAEIEQGYCNTDRKIPGTRLRHPGKGRRGNRLKVFECQAHKLELIQKPWSPYRREQPERKYSVQPLLDHNAAETYRCNSEVVYWLKRHLQEHPEVIVTKVKERKQ